MKNNISEVLTLEFDYETHTSSTLQVSKSKAILILEHSQWYIKVDASKYGPYKTIFECFKVANIDKSLIKEIKIKHIEAKEDFRLD